MAKKPLPSPEVLRQLLRYEPETGKLFWKDRPVSFFDGRAGTCAYWNRRYAGGEALTQVDTHGYRGGKIFKVRHLAHRIIWAMQTGGHPDGPLDHINGDRMDNRMCNLRIATEAENSRNGAIRASNTSGRKGVTWNRHNKRWAAQIGYVYGKRHLGYFDSVDAAAEAYDRAALDLHGEFARTNAMVNASEKHPSGRGRQARD